MKRTRTFLVDGQTLYVPEDRMEEFALDCEENGSAPEEIMMFKNPQGGDNLRVPVSRIGEFERDAADNGVSVMPMHTVTMDDGTHLTLGDEDVRQFVQARRQGMQMSRGLLRNTGIPEQYARSAEERSAVADQLGSMYYPEEEAFQGWKPEEVRREVDSYGGNISHEDRPMLLNEDENGRISGYSTAESAVIEDEDGKYVVVPMDVMDEDGKTIRFRTPAEAKGWYLQTGENYGRFASAKEAQRAAIGVHEVQQNANRAKWNDFIHANWDAMSDEIRNDPEVAAEHRRRIEAEKPGGFLDYLKTEKEAQYGRDLGGMEALAANLPFVGSAMTANENRKEFVEQKLYNGEYRDSLEASKLALSIGIPQEEVRRVNEAANGDPEATREGFSSLVRNQLADRIATKQKKGRKLSDFELNWLQQRAAGTVGMVNAVTEMSGLGTGLATLGVSAMNRASDLRRGEWTLDEEGNPVQVRRGDDTDTAMRKGLGGAAAERAIWMTKAPGTGRVVEAMGGGKLAKNVVQVGEMQMKSDLTDFVDNVLGLGLPENEAKKTVKQWADEHFMPEGLVNDVWETALAHGTMKAAHAVTPSGFRERRIERERKEARDFSDRIGDEVEKERRREEARERYDSSFGEEARYDVEQTLGQYVENGVITNPKSVEAIRRKVYEKLAKRNNAETHEAVEQAVLEATDEWQNPDRVTSEAHERRTVEAKMRENEMWARRSEELEAQYGREEAAKRLAEEQMAAERAKADEAAKEAEREARGKEIRATFDREDGKAAKDMYAERDRELEEYERQERERIDRENAEQAQAGNPEGRKPEPEYDGPSSPTRENRREFLPEYDEWLKKSGRDDSDKNWNRFVSENDYPEDWKFRKGDEVSREQRKAEEERQKAEEEAAAKAEEDKWANARAKIEEDAQREYDDAATAREEARAKRAEEKSQREYDDAITAYEENRAKRMKAEKQRKYNEKMTAYEEERARRGEAEIQREYDERMAAYEEARAKRAEEEAAKKKGLPVERMTEVPEKPTMNDIRDEKYEAGFRAWAVDKEGRPIAFDSKEHEAESRRIFRQLVEQGKVDGETGKFIGRNAEPLADETPVEPQKPVAEEKPTEEAAPLPKAKDPKAGGTDAPNAVVEASRTLGDDAMLPTKELERRIATMKRNIEFAKGRQKEAMQAKLDAAQVVLDYRRGKEQPQGTDAATVAADGGETPAPLPKAQNPKAGGRKRVAKADAAPAPQEVAAKARTAADAVRELRDVETKLVGLRKDTANDKEAAKAIAEKEKLAERLKAEIEELRAPIQPIPEYAGKPNPKKAAKVVEDFTDTEKGRNGKPLRPRLSKPFHDKKAGVVVATDGRMLIATKHGFDPNAKNEYENDFPNWSVVVPSDSQVPATLRVNPAELAKACENAIRLRRATGPAEAPIVMLSFGKNKYFFSAVNLKKMAQAMDANGIAELRGNDGDNHPPIKATNGDTTIVLMPYRLHSPDGIGRGSNNYLVIDGHTGRIISAPERTDALATNSPEHLKFERESFDGYQKDKLNYARQTNLYKAIEKAMKDGDTDPEKIYDSTLPDIPFAKMKPELQKQFINFVNSKDMNEVAQKIAEYMMERDDSGYGRKQRLAEIARVEKRIAAEDEIDNLLLGTKQARAALGLDGEAEARAQVNDTPMPKRLADPDFVAWAKKNDRTPTDGARREYDAQQVDALGRHVAKNWIRGVRFRRLVNEAEVPTGARQLYSRDGKVVGWYDSANKEVVTLPNADASTVAHELGWHATYDHAKELARAGDRKLLDRLERYANDARGIVVDPRTGRTLEQEITARYGQNGVTDPAALLDEIGAARYTMENVGRIKDAAARRQAAKWYERAWNGVADAYKSVLTKLGWNKARIDGIGLLSPEETVSLLADEMLKGRSLGKSAPSGSSVIDMNRGESLGAWHDRKLKDHLRPVEDLEGDAGKSESRSAHTLMRLIPGKVQAAENEARGFADEIIGECRESGVKVSELNEYMYAKAARARNSMVFRRNGRLDGSAMSMADIDRVLDRYDRSPKRDELERLRQKVLAFQERGFKERQRSGLIGIRAYTDMRLNEPDHVPMKSRFDEEGNHVGFDTNATFGRREFKEAQGRTNLGDGPLEWILQEYVDAKSRSAENEARKALLATVIAHPEVGSYRLLRQGEASGEIRRKGQAGEKNVITVKANGDTYAITLNGTRGEAIAQAVNHRGLMAVPQALQRGMRWWSSTATEWSPTFAFRNFLADTIDVFAVNTAEHGIVGGAVKNAQHVGSAVSLIPEIRKYVKTGKTSNALLREAIDAGVLMGGGVRGQAFDSGEMALKSFGDDIRKSHGAVRTAGRYALGWVNTLNQTAEVMNRIADYKMQRKAGKSKSEAALHAREITVDFNEKGEWTPATNLAYMFSNSSLGATMRLNRALFRGRNKYQLVGGLLGLGMLEGTIECLNDDDDGNMKNMSEFSRANSFYIRNGKDIYRVPLHASPISIIKYIGNCAARAAFGKLDAKSAAGQIGKDVLGMMTQYLGIGSLNDNAIASIAPSIIQPFVQMATGYDYAGRPIERQSHSDTQPKSWNGRESTASGYKEIAKAVNALGGGNEARRGSILGKSTDYSPEVYRHLAEAVGKNTFRDVSNSIELVKMLTGNAEWNRRNVPVVRDYYRETGGNDNRFYEAYERYKKDKDEFRKRTSWDRDEMREFYRERPWLKGARDGRTRIDRLVNEINSDTPRSGIKAMGITQLRKLTEGKVYFKGQWVEPKNPIPEAVKEKAKERLSALQEKVIELMGDEGR